jgi:TonB family protein
MRTRTITIAAVVSIVTFRAACAGAPPLCSESAASTSESLLAFYPPAAMAAHVGGTAVLRCGRTEQDVMTDCQLISEKPVGDGFGAAALALAAKSKAAPTATISPSQQRPRDVTFQFHADPLCITPNVFDMPWMPVDPHFARYPDFAQVASAWTAARASEDLGGSAVLSCKVEAGGLVTGCRVVEESPEGRNFGKAALMLTRYMALRPTTPDGVPMAGATVTILVPFWRPSPIGVQ